MKIFRGWLTLGAGPRRLYLLVRKYGTSVDIPSLSRHLGATLYRWPRSCAENPYQKTGTINRQENRACPIRCQKLISEKFGTKLHVRRVRNRYTSFWRWLPVSVSWVMNIIPDVLRSMSGSEFFMHRLAERSGQRRQLVFEVVTVQVDHVVVYDAVERHDLLRQSVELLCVLHENIHQFSSVQF